MITMMDKRHQQPGQIASFVCWSPSNPPFTSTKKGVATSLSKPLATQKPKKINEFHGNVACYAYRYYDPNLGKWINRDPIRERGGLNLYGFVGNKSISHLDLLGLDQIFDFYDQYGHKMSVQLEGCDADKTYKLISALQDMFDALSKVYTNAVLATEPTKYPGNKEVLEKWFGPLNDDQVNKVKDKLSELYFRPHLEIECECECEEGVFDYNKLPMIFSDIHICPKAFEDTFNEKNRLSRILLHEYFHNRTGSYLDYYYDIENEYSRHDYYTRIDYAGATAHIGVNPSLNIKLNNADTYAHLVRYNIE